MTESVFSPEFLTEVDKLDEMELPHEPQGPLPGRD